MPLQPILPISAPLLKKLNAVMADVDYIQKDKRNITQNYNYASEAAIKGAFHEAFTKHGIHFYWSVDGMDNQKYEVKDKDGKEKNLFQAIVKCTYRFCDVDTGEYYEGLAMGVGQDYGDKAIYKAITGALKYALTGNFLVETGDDAEDDKNDVSHTEVKKVDTEDPFYVEPKKTAKPVCNTCNVEVSDKVASFSVERYGRILCMNHQK